MSLYKTKHLKHIANRNRKLMKVEVDRDYLNGYHGYCLVAFMNGLGVPYWDYHTTKFPESLTGKLRLCIKSKGRARPHIFQKYVAPITERWE